MLYDCLSMLIDFLSLCQERRKTMRQHSKLAREGRWPRICNNYIFRVRKKEQEIEKPYYCHAQRQHVPSRSTGAHARCWRHECLYTTTCPRTWSFRANRRYLYQTNIQNTTADNTPQPGRKGCPHPRRAC